MEHQPGQLMGSVGKEMNWIATAATAEDYKAGLYHFPVGFIFQERIDYFLPVYNISY